jgi:transposase
MSIMDAKDKRIAEQGLRIADLESQLKAALDKIAALEKNSSTSSKPPSSDIVKPPKPKKGKQARRKIGAQPGHKQHLRKPIAPELVDEVVKLELTDCPDCGHKLELDKIEPKTTQQIELVEKPYTVTEYQQLMYWCKQCQCYHYVALPKEVEKAGLFGPKMTALTGYLKGRCHISYRSLKDYFHDVMGVEVSTGFLAKQIQKVSAALKSPYEELEELLKQQSHLNIDETSFKKNGKLQWAWCFVSEAFTFFKIDASRGSQVLKDVLGDDFGGSIGSDFYSAYRRYEKDTGTLFQFCWAHLIREIKFLATLDDTKAYGKRLLKYVKAMFATIHRQEELTEVGFKRLMNKHKKAILKTVRRFVPEHKKAAVLSERFEKYGESYFLFIEKPLVEATNNVAERAIRTLVLDRIVTQGVRSDVGNEWHERFWSVLATCKKLGINVMAFLRESLFCLFHGLDPPSLLPITTQE